MKAADKLLIAVTDLERTAQKELRDLIVIGILHALITRKLAEKLAKLTPVNQRIDRGR